MENALFFPSEAEALFSSKSLEKALVEKGVKFEPNLHSNIGNNITLLTLIFNTTHQVEPESSKSNGLQP